MIVSNLAVENRFANGTQGRLMSWYPAKIASNKAVLASHPELVARFVKETALTKSELFPDLVPYISSCTHSFEKNVIYQDTIDVIVRQETLPFIAGHPVLLQICVVPVACYRIIVLLPLPAVLPHLIYRGLRAEHPQNAEPQHQARRSRLPGGI